jgi:hypothetical protein
MVNVLPATTKDSKRKSDGEKEVVTLVAGCKDSKRKSDGENEVVTLVAGCKDSKRKSDGEKEVVTLVAGCSRSGHAATIWGAVPEDTSNVSGRVKHHNR